MILLPYPQKRRMYGAVSPRRTVTRVTDLRDFVTLVFFFSGPDVEARLCPDRPCFRAAVPVPPVKKEANGCSVIRFPFPKAT